MSREEDYLFDQLLKHALIDVEEKQVQEADQFCSEHSGPLPFQPSSRYRRSMRRLCLKSRLRERGGVKGIIKKGLIWVAVALALLLGLAMTTPASRDWLFHFFIQDKGDHLQIDFGKANINYIPIYINTKLERFYRPKWLPEGFILKNHQESDILLYWNFTNEDKSISITQAETNEYAELGLDSENAVVQRIKIQHMDALCIQKDYYTLIVMQDGNLSICIDGIGVSKEIIVKVAKNMLP